jgi:two-component system LytT family sensor kinase
MPKEAYLVTLLVKLGVVASLASILTRSSGAKRMLLRERRTLNQRLRFALWFATIFGAGVATRVVTGSYLAVDLGLEASLLAGILGGYFTGLLVGALVSIPAMFNHELLSMPLLAAVGVMGGLLRDCASDTEDIWSFTPLFHLHLPGFSDEQWDRRRTVFHGLFLAAILFAEFLRQGLGSRSLFGPARIFYLEPAWPANHALAVCAVYVTTLLSVVLPLKIWNNARNEQKLQEQESLLMQARLDTLTRQINPHFLFNTLNSVSALIRTNPQKARVVVYQLSNILRRLLRKHDNFNSLREELSFIDDYLSIEVVRFGDKLRFRKEIEPAALDMQLPSMLLQPLIENCIKHGLASKVEGGSITLRATRSEGRLHLVVEDDGVGIPDAQMANLLDRGIGVSNVNERLKVLFGADHSMRIDSKQGRGTRIEIDVPELQTRLAAVS